MGKFPVADAAMLKVWVCKKCKARNPAHSKTCRKCFGSHLRPKRQRKKETKG